MQTADWQMGFGCKAARLAEKHWNSAGFIDVRSYQTSTKAMEVVNS
jgi:hypothetical protein